MKSLKLRFYDPISYIFIYSDWYEKMSEFFETYEKTHWGRNSQLPLQQYTGLQDASGQKIFEGDILELDRGLSDYHYVVEWVFAGFQLVTYKKPNSTVRGSADGINQGYFEESDNVTVIGNIYENEELLNEHK
jgi:uncharacterized phage protein (TIGR01671 family)